ncbi:hypothetical protein BD289DRAFT_485381 [Coniella lustricola]|uniref:Rhodopsin domain-containing protein n=1 Tax=Coniella lustricola TaxID=2025994 RepID=A0A2T2ZYV6_9PEZI|nr:hypothetical protein BD289DRAFT_485381 [Coniella lustricola]
MTFFPLDTPETRTPLIVSTFFGVLALLSYIARLYSIGVPHTRPRLDDWLILAALVLVYVSLGIQWACVTLGGTGRHITDVEAVDPSAVVLTLQLILPFEALYGITLMLVKFSMLRFYARIFAINKTFTIAVWTAATVIFLWMVSVVLETFLLCRPLAYNWDTTIADGTCGNRQAVYVGAGVSNMVTDFMVLLLPVPFVWKLKMPTASKMGLLGIFCLGIFITAISIVRLKSLMDISFTDPTWTLPMGLLWTVLEPELAIINANLPLMKRLFTRMLPRLFSSSRSRGTGGNGLNASGSHLNQFEKLGDDSSNNNNNIMLRTIGGGERIMPASGSSGNGSRNRETRSSLAAALGGQKRGMGGVGGAMAGKGTGMAGVGVGGPQVPLGNNYIVRHTAFHVEVESLSDDGVKSAGSSVEHV